MSVSIILVLRDELGLHGHGRTIQFGHCGLCHTHDLNLPLKWADLDILPLIGVLATMAFAIPILLICHQLGIFAIDLC